MKKGEKPKIDPNFVTQFNQDGKKTKANQITQSY
jgi:hypothetical protein